MCQNIEQNLTVLTDNKKATVIPKSQKYLRLKAPTKENRKLTFYKRLLFEIHLISKALLTIKKEKYEEHYDNFF